MLESKTIVCVVGMHRSGTSVASRMIELLGASLGPEDRLMEARPDNPKGFFEHRFLSQINDEILSRFGGSWDSPPTFPDGWVLSPDLGDLRQRALDILGEDFGAAPFWSWKDPRTSLTLPFWQQLLPSMRYVICFRNPAGVARSLRERNGLATEKSGFLWLTYAASALRWTSGRSRLLLFYEDVMQDRERELARLAAFVGAPDPDGRIQPKLRDFLEDDLFHHRPRISQVVDDPDLPFPAKALYLALRTHQAGPASNHPDIDAALDLFSAHARERHLMSEREGHQLIEMRRDLSGAEADRVRLEKTVSQLSASVSEIAAERDRRIAEHQETSARLQKTVSQLSGSVSEIAAERDRRIGEHQETAARLQKTVSQLSGSVSEIAAERDRRIGEHQETAARLVFSEADRKKLAVDRNRMMRAFETQVVARSNVARLQNSSPMEVAAAMAAALGLMGGTVGRRLRRALSLARRPARLRDAYVITQSGILDEPYYRSRNPDVASGHATPLAHFVLYGSLEGRNPHPLFDCGWYARSNAGQLAGCNPLCHYLLVGARQGLAPHPLFDVGFYVRSLQSRPLIDSNPLIDYLLRGVVEGRSPHPLFDPGFYCEQNSDVTDLGIDPFAHFVCFGAAEGRAPHPLFDCARYLAQNPDVRDQGLNPLQHFLDQGWREGRQPSSRFDVQFYLESNEDIRSAGINPLLHFVIHGRDEGRRAVRLSDSERVAAPRLALAPPAIKLVCRSLAPISTQPVVADEKPIVICLSHVMPWPPRAGNEYRIFRLLRWLKTAGYRIVPVIAPLPGVAVDDDALRVLAGHFSNAVLCHRDGRVDYIVRDIPDVLASLNGTMTPPFARLLEESSPITARDADLLEADRTFCHDTLIAASLKLSQALTRQILLVEYVWMSRIMPLLPGDALKVIDSIDVFSSKREKVIDFGVSDRHLEPEEEARRLRYADLVVAIQDDERNQLQRLVPDKRLVIAGVDFDLAPDGDGAAARRVLLVASDNVMNRKGLSDFLRFAWPRIRREVPDAELLLAGPIGTALPDDIPGTVRVGSPENLAPLYREARVVINPAVAGTGLKIKTVEALSHLRPIVAWPSGSDGLPADLAALCHTARDWYEFTSFVVNLLQTDEPLRCSPEERAMIERFISPARVYGDLALALEAAWMERSPSARDAAHTL